jgi:hypothetical protein
MAEEVHHLEAHPALIMSVIKRQAGTLAKAALEGVMNAVDARATKIELSIDRDQLILVDDGKGFGDVANIHKFFKVFGQPHEGSENKIFGTFRMGRGQLFAFGRNVWRTGPNLMDVDVEKRGLAFTLKTDCLDDQPGCRIVVSLYEKLNLAAISELRRDLELWCYWAPIQVFLNGELLSHNPQEAKWDHETDEAYIKLKETGTLDVYNLGIHVHSYSGHVFGCGGDVVSKKQLKVNFARNDIQSDCPVWRKIKPIVNQRATEKNNKKSLTDAGRQRIADQVISGEMDAGEAGDIKLFTAVTGRHYSFHQLTGQHAKCFSLSPRGDHVGGLIHDRELAFVFATETLERWHVKTGPALLKRIKDLFAPKDSFVLQEPFKPLEKLSEGFTGKYVALKDDELNPNERVWMTLLRRMSRHLLPEVYGGYPSDADLDMDELQDRVLNVGLSKVADAWTDGSSYVVLSRDFLAQQDFTVLGLTQVAHVLLHVGCHNKADMLDHEHDPEFYEKYHQLCMHGNVGRFVKEALSVLPKVMRELNRKLTKTQISAIDANNAAGELAAVN